MSFELDRDWVEAVCRICDPVFESADVGFVRQMSVRRAGEIAFVGLPEMTDTAEEVALLWEADPGQFAERYPDSRIVESYGEQWPNVPCIDYWVKVDGRDGQARLTIEGWPDPNDLSLTGDGTRDGLAIGTVVAAILRVPSPTG